MAELVYPSSKFVKSAMAVIRSGDELNIKVFSLREKKLLSALLPDLVDTDTEQNGKSDWGYLISMFLTLRFITVFFYAKSGGYRASFVTENSQLLITMSPRRLM